LRKTFLPLLSIPIGSVVKSISIEPAKAFLSSYHSVSDTYRACAVTNVMCDFRSALEKSTTTINLNEFEVAIEKLKGLGVPIIANGRLDFDHDYSYEQWFIVQHTPDSDLELWVLAFSDVRVKAMFVDTVDNLDPTLLLYSTPRYSYPIDSSTFQFNIGNDAIYNFIRRQRDQEPYVTKQSGYGPHIYERVPGESTLDRVVDDLLSGAEPEDILVRLQNWANNPDFERNNRYYYYLGLTYELLEDEDNAVNAYLLAWQDCCDSWQHPAQEIVIANPYAIMARAKLEPVHP